MGLSISKSLEVREKGRTENNIKVGKMFFYVILDFEIFTYLKNRRYLILIVNSRKFNVFIFLTGVIHHVMINGD